MDFTDINFIFLFYFFSIITPHFSLFIINDLLYSNLIFAFREKKNLYILVIPTYAYYFRVITSKSNKNNITDFELP